MPRLIKRYSNRKLYDTESSTYVTLEDVEGMVRQGEDLRIVDNPTGDDITGATLAHIVLEQQKVNPSFPLAVLRGIIQSGEEFFGRLQWPVVQFREEFRRRAESLEDRGKAIREFVDGTQHSLDEMQQGLDDRFRDALDQLTPIAQMRSDLRQMRRRIDEMEQRLDQLAQASGEGPEGGEA